MEEADVVVIGSGVAGLTTALVAAAHGLKVIVLEKTALVGGATAYSAGGAFLPGSHLLPPEGDSTAPFTYLAHCIGSGMDSAIVSAYLEHAPAALAFLERETEVRFQPYGGLDYRSDAPGASAYRTVLPTPFDGRQLGTALRQLRPPLDTLTIFGGMQVDYADLDRLVRATRSPRAALYAARLLIAHCWGQLRWGRSPRLVFGNALAARLFKSVRDRAGEIDLRLCARAVELVIDSNRVIGVRYRHGSTLHMIAAGAGVMLGSGGFPGNPQMRSERTLYPRQHRSLAPTSNQGDGIAMARRAGARLSSAVADYCYTPVSVLRSGAGERLYPHFALDRCKPGAIAVGTDGARFVNEAAAYSDFVPAMLASGAVPAFLVCDHRFLRTYGLGLVRPAPFGYRSFIRRGYLVRGRTIGQLARVLGIDSAGLARTVERNNHYAASGIDEEFGKGQDAYTRSQGDPAHGPNPCLGPISKPPYYAIRLYPGDTATTSGLVVDTNARVLDDADRPIAGLYASGPDMANPTLGTNPSGGCNIGPALTFGYVAARHMARERRSQSCAPARSQAA